MWKDKERYHNDPVFRQKCIDSSMKWAKEHPKKAYARHRRYYYNHHKERLAYSNQYQKEHKQENKKKWKKKYDSDPIFRDKMKKKVKQWRNKNREHYNEYMRSLMNGKLRKSS
jgi:hypothetical protein